MQAQYSAEFNTIRNLTKAQIDIMDLPTLRGYYEMIKKLTE